MNNDLEKLFAMQTKDLEAGVSSELQEVDRLPNILLFEKKERNAPSSFFPVRKSGRFVSGVEWPNTAKRKNGKVLLYPLYESQYNDSVWHYSVSCLVDEKDVIELDDVTTGLFELREEAHV